MLQAKPRHKSKTKFLSTSKNKNKTSNYQKSDSSKNRYENHIILYYLDDIVVRTTNKKPWHKSATL